MVRENEELVFNGDRTSVLEGEKIQEMGVGVGGKCTYLAPLKCTVKYGSNTMLYIL